MDYADKIANSIAETVDIKSFNSVGDISINENEFYEALAKAAREGYNLGYGLTQGVAVPALVR
jgi:hypothetical protein